MSVDAPTLAWAPGREPTHDERDWYEIGYLRGYDHARAEIEAAGVAAWAGMRDFVRDLAKAPTHEEAQRRRTEHVHHDPILRASAERAAKITAIAGWEAYLRVVRAEWGLT